MSLLLRYMISFCHKCGNIDNFDVYVKPYKDNDYFLCYKCKKCNEENKVVCSKQDLNEYFGDEIIKC